MLDAVLINWKDLFPLTELNLLPMGRVLDKPAVLPNVISTVAFALRTDRGVYPSVLA